MTASKKITIEFFHNILVKKNWVKNFWVQKKFLILEKLGLKKILSQKKISSKKDFGLKKLIIQGKYDSMQPPPQP